MVIGANIKSSGDRLSVDALKPVFVHGAWNLGPILEMKEIETAGFYPGYTVDPVATAADQEDNVTIGGNASVILLGIAELDYGQISACTDAYSVADMAPIIYFHWNPGALLQHVYTADAAGNMEPGELLGTTSGVAGKLKDDTTTAVCMRNYKYVADAGAGGQIILAFIHGYL